MRKFLLTWFYSRTRKTLKRLDCLLRTSLLCRSEDRQKILSGNLLSHTLLHLTAKVSLFAQVYLI